MEKNIKNLVAVMQFGEMLYKKLCSTPLRLKITPR